mmetsp:Transcript_7180/g.22980  ORF Transcript_7180/g.22980 Transcript_7180/m.22980 type:complete len:261 (-) Transcript_7180:98-880(-)
MSFDHKQQVTTGTTCIAFIYADGVLLGADSRTTQGRFIGERVQSKIQQIGASIYLMRSGSSATTQYVGDIVRHYVEAQALEGLQGAPAGSPAAAASAAAGRGTNVCPSTVSTRLAARLFNSIVQSNGGRLQGAFVIAGVDNEAEDDDAAAGNCPTAHIYQVPLGGGLVKAPYALAGSGFSSVNESFKSRYRPGLSEQEARALMIDTVRQAIFHDNSSGGVVRLLYVTPEGSRAEFIDPNVEPNPRAQSNPSIVAQNANVH